MAWNPQSMITFHGTTPWTYSDTVWIACWLLSVEQYKVWINKDVFGLILEWNSSIVCYWSGERCHDEKSSVNIFPVRACTAPVVLTRPQSSSLVLIRSHYHPFDYPMRRKQPHYWKKYQVVVSYPHSVLEIIALGGTHITWQRRLMR